MLKKYSFRDTRAVLSGSKTVEIVAAPVPPPGWVSFHLIDGHLLFTDGAGRTLSRFRMPLVPGLSYKVMRPYREIGGHAYSAGDYAWRDRRAVAARLLPDSFTVTGVEYLPAAEVPGEDWRGNGGRVESEYVYVCRIRVDGR